MASVALTPDKARRAAFPEPGAAGFVCRDRCFANNVVMRSVKDRMIISPPLTMTKDEIDILMARVTLSLDEAYAHLVEHDMMHAG